MPGLFNPDNPVLRFLSFLFDIIFLNVIFLFCCIPVFTAGASLTALYYVCLKIRNGEEPPIWKSFWKSFRENFKESTLLWMLSLLLLVFFGMDFSIVNARDTALFAVIRILLTVICLYLGAMFLYAFPILSHFVCSTGQVIKNAAYMTAAHPGVTAALLALRAVLAVLLFAAPVLRAFVVVLSGVCGFSGLALLDTLLLRPVFSRYEP